MRAEYEGPPCAKCGGGLANVTPDEGPAMRCPFCHAVFDHDCFYGHHCEEMERDGQGKLAAWATAAQGWGRA